MKTKVVVSSDFDKTVIYPVGSEAVIIEELDDQRIIAEIRIPDTSLAGGGRFDTVVINRNDLEE